MKIREKNIIFVNANKNTHLLPRFSECKDKEKWQEIVKKAKLFLQKLRTTVYRRLCSITIGDHALSYKGCHSELKNKILKILVRGIGIRYISYIEQVIVNKVLSVLVKSEHKIKPEQSHYDKLEVDEFWTYVGNKKNKVWLISHIIEKRVKLWLMFGANETGER